MATIVTKFSDYVIHSVEYFIDQIETELGYRDLPGLFNNKVQKINVTKEHPLAAFMAASLNDVRNTDHLRSSIIPAISVTPGNMSDEGFTLGQSFRPETVDSDFIDRLKYFLNKTNREIQQELLITKNQIETIIGEYNRASENGIRVQINEWHKNEEINVSVWSDTPDIDVALGNIMDSVMATIQVGFSGDESTMRYFRHRVVKGLTNFNFGRVLFGTEYNLTFLNTYKNYIIYTDDVISGHDFEGTFTTPGETS